MGSLKTREDYQAEVVRLNKAAELYYKGETTDFTDEEFDAHIDALRRYEEENNINNPDSPTQKVNEGSSEDKIDHYAPLLSLRDLFNKESLVSWISSKGTKQWCVEEKIDGLSIELVYDHGTLQRAVTRGNGYKGMDVTAVVREIPTLPTEIDYPNLLVWRCEVYMPTEQFEAYREEFGKGANARNLAVGLVKRLNDTSGAKYLRYFVFNLQKIVWEPESEKQLTPFSMPTHAGQLAFAKHLGFTIVNSVKVDESRVWDAVEEINARRSSLPYNIDGAVIKADSMGFRAQAGDDGAVPRWAVAYKYPAKEAKTEVLGFEFNLGKTGKLTPVALLKPVKLEGSEITRATVHNKDRMLALDIRVGDIVTIFKAGDIIPAIKSAERTPNSKDFEYPTTCPRCGQPLSGERCVNMSCPQKVEIRLHYWVSKSGLDIKGLSSSTVQSLIDAKAVRSIADFYRLTPGRLKLVPRFGATKIKKTLDSIESSRGASFSQVLASLCIESLGYSSAYKLEAKYPTWDALLEASMQEFKSILGDVAGEKIYLALRTNYYQKTIAEIREIFPF